MNTYTYRISVPAETTVTVVARNEDEAFEKFQNRKLSQEDFELEYDKYDIIDVEEEPYDPLTDGI
jgi:hypothetical protein